MLGQLYIIPFTNTLIIAKDYNDAKAYTSSPLQFIKDIRRNAIYIDDKKRIRLKTDYMGNTAVQATQCVREELQCYVLEQL